MILELNGTKVTIVDKTLGYQGDNLVNTIQVTVDKDSTWNYKLDMYKGKSKCFDSVLMTREGNVCTVQLTNEILSYGGRYIFQLRGYTDTQTYHSDIFESWVNASIEYQYDCKQADCGCDCKLPTEFYQVEDNVTEINNHPPYPGDNGKWMIWDVNKHEYVESDIEVVGGGTDISLGITSAAVGDIVKVKAVDGNGVPTQWEAVKMPGEGDWFKIGEYTWTAEDAAETNIPRIKFTQDSEGNPLALDAVFIWALPLIENNGSRTMGLMCSGRNNNSNYFLWANALAHNVVCTVLAEVKKGTFPPIVETKYTKAAQLNGGGGTSISTFSPKASDHWEYPLNTVQIWFQSQILEGSKFEFYGRNAT